MLQSVQTFWISTQDFAFATQESMSLYCAPELPLLLPMPLSHMGTQSAAVPEDVSVLLVTPPHIVVKFEHAASQRALVFVELVRLFVQPDKPDASRPQPTRKLANERRRRISCTSPI